MNFADERQLQGLEDPAVGLGRRPQPVGDTVQNSYGYQTLLNAAGIYAGVRGLSRGSGGLGSVMNIAGMGIPAGLDFMVGPAKAQAQSTVDRAWLRNSLANDDKTDPWGSVRKGSMKQRTPEPTLSLDAALRIRALVKASQSLRAAVEGRYVLVPKHPGLQKESSPIVSPLDKRSNLSAILRDSIGEAPYPIPGQGALDSLADAVRFRPQLLGGPSGPERIGMKALDLAKGLLVQDNYTLNASGVPIQKTTTLLPGMVGKIARLPLALGALLAVQQGYSAFDRWNTERKSEGRFNEALNALRTSPGFREYNEYLDESTPEGREAIESLRGGFNMLNRYAPEVAKDPQIAGHYLESFTRGMEGRGISPGEYTNLVREAVQLNASISQGAEPRVGALGTTLGRLVEAAS